MKHRALTLLLLAGAPLLSGCPLPIAGTVTQSAPVVGRVNWADGRPASGLDVALATGWSDTECDKVALRARTDSAGIFQFPKIERHYSTTWVVPNLDRATPRFSLCANVGGTQRAAYAGYGSLREGIRPDTIACVIWEFADTARINCAGRSQRRFVTGGHWVDTSGAGAEGFYRILLTEQPTVIPGSKKHRVWNRPYLYVQWVESRREATAAEITTPYAVRTTMSLPFDRVGIYSADGLQLWRRNSRWIASFEGHKHGFMDNMAWAEVDVELGAPGQATLVAGP